MTPEHKLREYTETRMKRDIYDNIMELMSCLDYCFVGLSMNGLQTLTEVKNKHAIISNRNELNII